MIAPKSTLQRFAHSLVLSLQGRAALRSARRQRFNEKKTFATAAEVYESRAMLSAPAFGTGFAVNFSQAGAATDSAGKVAATDSAGDVYVAGSFNGSGDMDPGPGVATLVNPNPFNGGSSVNGFVAKYDVSGNFQWALPLTSPRSYARGVAVGPVSGDLYVTGAFVGSMSLPTVQGTTLTVTGGTTNFQTGFIARLDHSTGAVVWLQAFTSETGVNNSNFFRVAVDASENVYATDEMNNTPNRSGSATLVYAYGPGTGGVPVTFTDSTGLVDGFVKFDSNGNALWSGQFVDANTSSSLYAGYMSVDSAGNIYYTGGVQGTVDVDPGSGTHNLTSAGQHDIVIEKLDTNGNLLWVKQNGGTGDEAGTAIFADSAGNVDVGFAGVYTKGTGKKAATGNVAQFDGTGNLRWLATPVTPSAGISPLLAVDGGNNLYVNLYVPGSSAGGIAKYGATGNLVWKASMGKVSPQGAAIDASGDIWWTGSIGGQSINVSPGPAPAYLTGNSQGSFLLVEWTQPGGLASASSALLPAGLATLPSSDYATKPALVVADLPSASAPLPAVYQGFPPDLLDNGKKLPLLWRRP